MPNVLVDQPTKGVTQLTLNRPDQLNAMTAELVAELHDALDAIAADRSCRAVVLTGAGRAFSSGLDLGRTGPEVHQHRLPLSCSSPGRGRMQLPAAEVGGTAL